MTDLLASDLAPLAVIVRDHQNESFHFGTAALVDPAGEVLEQLGNIQAPIYPRSALKPLQALTLYRLGLRLPPEETVMTMASHHSTAAHISAVRSVLASAGRSEADLKCPPALPWNLEMRMQVSTPQAIYHNCSGKHSGFLAACELKHWDLASYLDPGHPLQQQIMATIEELSGEKVSKTTIDGCGAPLFAISTLGLARSISQFGQQGKDLIAAALAHPELIGDKSTPDAAFLRAGLFSKLGAEGVFTVSTDSGYAVAIKIADGSLRAAPLIALELLSRHGLISDTQRTQIATDCEVEVLGGGKPVGGLELLF